uniref:Solute carrier family 19 member 1 n=1 Tax=Catagonus wagneri TaxID=51154 RepID=A0A8C4FH23_9CETA
LTNRSTSLASSGSLGLPSWWCLVFFLCFYGFLAQMRPGESFITPYLLGPHKNFTQKQFPAPCHPPRPRFL